MSRQLTALEKYRITGSHDAREQFVAFERLGIPATPRLSIGSQIIECMAQTDAVRNRFSREQWIEIRDENIGTADRLVNLSQSFSKQDSSQALVTHHHSANLAESLDLTGSTECVEQRRRHA